MCGITGIVSKQNQNIAKDVLERVNSTIAHRGPDDEGYFFGSNFALGHRRLSILDLSQDGHQPMSYADRYVVVYNGEIYNYVEIRQELESLGYSFISRTDTEVLLAAYAEWGSECVSRFNGMWAFALYDKRENKLFLSRDRFGIKPLYYIATPEYFCFGSEIRQLLPLLPKRVVNSTVLMDYLVSNLLDHSSQTFFKGLEKLPASHNMIYCLESHEYQITRYYSIPDLNEEEHELDQAVSRYRGLLESAIGLRLRSDVKVGTCLSGGMDSSSVAAIAATLKSAESTEPFAAITSKAIDPEVDETHFARQVVDRHGLDWSVIAPDYNMFSAAVDTVIEVQEEPFGGPSIFMQYFVMEEAKKRGCKVMLDGQGGDETLLGYERYYPAVYFDVFKKQGLLSALRAIRDSHQSNGGMSVKAVIKYSIGTFFWRLRSAFNRRRCRFVKSRYLNDASAIRELSKAYGSVFDLQVKEITQTNLPELLRYEDKNSMHHSVEARLPMIDYRLVEFALNQPSGYKVNNGWSKYILRRAAEKLLPDEVVWRKTKLGFNAPERTWLGQHQDAMKQEITESGLLHKYCNMQQLLEGFSGMDRSLQWRLYNIACWERLFNVSAD